MKVDGCFGKRVAGNETTRRGVGRIHGGNRQGQESAVAMLKIPKSIMHGIRYMHCVLFTVYAVICMLYISGHLRLSYYVRSSEVYH